MNTENKKTIFYNTVSITIGCYTLIALCRQLYKYLFYYSSPHETFWYTEYLINYQGGYVRRGLLGEIMYQLNSLIPDINPGWYILLITLCTVTFVVYYLVKNFRKAGLCWWILPLNVCLFGGEIVRRDFLCMSFLIIILEAWKKTTSQWKRFIYVSLLIITALNIHEAFFFICCPFIILLYISDSTNKKCSIMGICTIILAMTIVCLNKGNFEISDKIWKSWYDTFPSYKQIEPSDSDLDFNRASIGAISWDTLTTFKFHITSTYLTLDKFVMGWYSKPLTWLAILFLIPNILFIKKGWIHNRNSKQVTTLLKVMIFQFFSLLPMFTVLSCDSSRICFYWTISSFIIYFYLSNSKHNFIWAVQYEKRVEIIQKKLFFNTSSKIALFILPFIAIEPYTTSFMRIATNSIIGTYCQGIYEFITKCAKPLILCV